MKRFEDNSSFCLCWSGVLLLLFQMETTSICYSITLWRRLWSALLLCWDRGFRPSQPLFIIHP
jgi:hypothetical protein